MSLLDDIKIALRISAANTVYDSEIEDLMGAALADLELSGVDPAKLLPDSDALIKRAVTTYVKAHFGWDNPDAERLQQAYDRLKAHLTLSQDYLPREDDGEGEGE